MKKVEQECFDQNILLVYNNNVEVISNEKTQSLKNSMNQFRYFLPTKNNSLFNVTAQLPPGLTCKYCVLQWKYHAGNNFGVSERSKLSCLGCADKQEEFFNCADIAILKLNSSDNLNDLRDWNNTNIIEASSSINIYFFYSFSYKYFLLFNFVIIFILN